MTSAGGSGTIIQCARICLSLLVQVDINYLVFIFGPERCRTSLAQTGELRKSRAHVFVRDVKVAASDTERCFRVLRGKRIREF